MKKSLFLSVFLTALFFAFSLFAEDATELNELYPVESAATADDVTDAVEDTISDILDGLDLTEEEKALLNSPLSDDELSKAGTDEAESQAEDLTPKEESEPAFEDKTAEETEAVAEETSSDEEEEEEKPSKKGFSLAGVSEVPPSRRPKPFDKDKAKAAQEKDESEDVPKNNRNTIQFGIPSEISALIDTLISNDDPRFTEEIYDLFQVSKNTVIQTKVLEYFSKMEDPCLEDFAVTVLNDPYDSKVDLVKACFSYIQKVHTKEALPAVFSILESENEAYFNDTLSTIGEIGESDAAVALSEYLDREDLSDAQRQSLMRTLGKLHALSTFDRIVEILENEDENIFVRMYAAEALGLMEKEDAVPHLVSAFKDANPNLRQYALKGLANFPKNEDAKASIIQGIRDEHWKVRQEAIRSTKEMEIKGAVGYLEYRAEHDSERVIKEEAITVLGKFKDKEAGDFLISLLDKKVSDGIKIKTVSVLLENEKGEKEILSLAEKTLGDVRQKNLCKGIGKELAKHSKKEFSEICLKYLENSDADIVGLGLDMYKNFRMGGEVEAKIKALYDDKKTNSTNRARAKRLLGIED